MDRLVVEVGRARRGRARPIRRPSANARPYRAFCRLNPISRSAASDSSRNRVRRQRVCDGLEPLEARPAQTRARPAARGRCAAVSGSRVPCPTEAGARDERRCRQGLDRPPRGARPRGPDAARSSATGTATSSRCHRADREDRRTDQGPADSASGCARPGPNPSRRSGSSRPLAGPQRPRPAPAGANRPRHRRRGPRRWAPRPPGGSRRGRTRTST